MSERIINLFFILLSIITKFEKLLSQDASRGSYLTETDFARAKFLKSLNITSFAKHSNKSGFLNENLFEGDIIDVNITKIRQMQSDEFEFMSAKEGVNNKWPFATVPYEMDTSLSSSFRSMMAMAMDEVQSVSCVKFIPSNKYKGNTKALYIYKTTDSSCSSTIGRNFPNDPKMGFDDKLCPTKKGMVHELFHVLGFCHEQSREDRDSFVSINYKYVKKGCEGQFEKYTLSLGYRPITPYDYNSIMHYPSTAFSADGTSATITAKRNAKLPDEPPEEMSRFDIIKLNKHYNCGEYLKGCKDANSQSWCLQNGLGLMSNGIMEPAKAKCVDENWSKKNCIKTCGDCYRLLK